MIRITSAKIERDMGILVQEYARMADTVYEISEHLGTKYPSNNISSCGLSAVIRPTPKLVSIQETLSMINEKISRIEKRINKNDRRTKATKHKRAKRSNNA